MSTTEQPALAIGSPAYYRNMPPYVNIMGHANYQRTHVWTDDHGVTQGLIDLDSVTLTFHEPDQVRELIGQLAVLAGEMDAETARHQAQALAHDPATCTNGDHYGQCSGVTQAAPAWRAAARDAEAAQVTR